VTGVQTCALPICYAQGEGSDTEQFQGFAEAARNQLEGVESAKLHPLKTGEWFARTSREVLELVADAEKRAGANRSKEFESTVVDLKILARLAEYHSRRVRAGFAYALFKQSQDVNAFDDAIAAERGAIEAWEGIVEAASDFYADDLKMGQPAAGLTGHWRDELVALRKGLAALEAQRQALKPAPSGSGRMQWPAAGGDREAPTVEHTPVVNAPAGQPVTIIARVRDASGVKWVRLRHRSVDQYFDFQTLAMHPTGKPDEFAATVPADQIPPRWDFMYFIEAMDTKGNGRIFPDFETTTPYVIVRLQR
jgi:hypothetical protein